MMQLTGFANDGALIVGGFPLVEFGRAPVDPKVLRGFTLGWNAELTLIQVMDDVHYRLNGYAIFRNSDVKRWRSVVTDDFAARAAQLNKLRPNKPPKVRFASMKEAISSAGKEFPLITIHQERTDKRVCFVGKLQGANQRTATILAISPRAEWEDKERYQLKDITLLEFGGAYETLLTRMASPTD